MLGWINDCVEKLVIEKFGLEAWHQVKQKAGCTVKDNGFLKLEHYSDKSTIALVEAAAVATGLTVDAVYEAFGQFFVEYVIERGYERLLACQGSTLRDWMSNINAIHQHLQTTFPKKMTMPEFWCETNSDGTLELFYISRRGNYLAPIAVGLVKEGASRFFDLSLVFTMRSKQGVSGAKFTCWTVSTKDSNDIPKLTKKKGTASDLERLTRTDSFCCPMSGMMLSPTPSPNIYTMSTTDSGGSRCPVSSMDQGASDRRTPEGLPSIIVAKGDHASAAMSPHCNRPPPRVNSSCSSNSIESDPTDEDEFDVEGTTVGLSPAMTKNLFPYHVIVNRDFEIKQVGQDLPRVLGSTSSVVCGNEIDEVFAFITPKTAKWTQSWLRKLQNQEIVLACSLSYAPADIFFKGSIMRLNSRDTMLILCPDAKSLEELARMQLTLSDLPAHGSYRDAVFLREHLSQQMNNALHMEKLSRTLQTEKELLESLIPSHAANELRTGKRVEPMNHDHVTMFFSDVVGFTNICKHLSPTQVIGMLNQLYGLMDFLVEKFGLFKVETIGDTYVCCSGLPDPDEEHASKVAHFALAVKELSRYVLSPLDGSPIQLRIGIHSGSCASGIVGHRNPRYCVFGDTVNTTARHESTGKSGRVHCSLSTMKELQSHQSFEFISRGMVNMKGKGEMPTYWLEASSSNEFINPVGVERLRIEALKRVRQQNCRTSSPSSSSQLVESKACLNLDSTHPEKESSSRQPQEDVTSVQSRKSRGSRGSCSTSKTPSRKELARRLSQMRGTAVPSSYRSRRRRTNSNGNAKTGIEAALDIVSEPDQ